MNSVKKVEEAEKKLVSDLGLSDRVFQSKKKEAYITLKDHKDNFANNPKARLINPAKTEVGKISKIKLDSMIREIRTKTLLKSWRATNDTLCWFNALPNRQLQTFLEFDIVSFYPTISELLLTKAVDWGSKFVNVSQMDKAIIMQARQSMLFLNMEPWSKKSGEFDVTMGAWDGAEICELIGLYMLSIISDKLNINVGLYRDDGLGVLTGTPQQNEKLKKDLCLIFRAEGLEITVAANKKVVNFLDVNLDLNTGIHRPYSKPNNKPIYVNSQSNHPPSVLRAVPNGINVRLSNISSNEDVFNVEKGVYQEALKEAGYEYELKYHERVLHEPPKNRKRTRKVIWFNPPYSVNCKIDIGRKYLDLVRKCFPPRNKLHKFLNTNTLKISYKCMPNMAKIISSHNVKVLEEVHAAVNIVEKTPERTCNCRGVNLPCPLSGNCLDRNLIYQATVTTNVNDKVVENKYIGLTSTTFKERLGNHKTDFKHSDKRKSTSLAEFIWKLNDSNIKYKIKWKKMASATPYCEGSKKCQLCVAEKHFIIFQPLEADINCRNELPSQCRHKRKKLLIQ